MSKYKVCTVMCGGKGPMLSGVKLDWGVLSRDNSRSPCASYNLILLSTTTDILIYIHDDAAIYDPSWLTRVLSLFESKPDMSVLGLGGAPRLGHPDMYKKPYCIQGMARDGYVSNQRDWEVHGGHETGSRQVAVVDAFFMAVRTDLLKRAGGWPVSHLTHHCLDLWVCLEAARQGKEVWMTGVDCMHFGGGSSTKPAYREAKWLQGGSLESDHQIPHVYLYNEYRDVLPLAVEGDKA